MPNKNRTFESILNEGLTTEPASIIFDEVIDDVEDSKYHKNLKEILYLIFDYPHKHYTFKHFEV
ncbi:TPA: hypothetical protein ACKEO1_002567 [Enterococcus faecium]